MSYALIQNHELISDEIVPAIVPWWSFTKTILAAAALVLVRDRILSLDEPCPGKTYTLRQLLQHEAGLADYGSLTDYHDSVKSGMPPWSTEELLTRVNALKPASAAGSNWAYSNIGYLHVRQLIERGVDDSLDSALDRLVFRPLGLQRTRVANLPSDLSDVVMGNISNYHPGWVYHGLVVGPLTDAVAGLRELLTGSLLPEHLLTEMLRARPLGGPIAGRPWTSPGYGLGVMAGGTDNKLFVVGHTGSGPGSVIAVYHTTQPIPITCAAFATSKDAGDVESIVVSKLIP